MTHHRHCHHHWHHWFLWGWLALFLARMGVGGLLLNLLGAVTLTLVTYYLFGAVWGIVAGTLGTFLAILVWAVK